MEHLITQHFTVTTFISVVLGYLLGSVPFGLVITKLAGLGDIRAIGSGNIGATNVLRTGRKDLAALTLVLDGGKGAAAVLIASHFGLQAEMGAAFGSVLGHFFPVWLRFKGGKGVATTLGVLLAFVPYVGLVSIFTWLLTAFITRVSSLSAIVAMAVAPFYTAWIYTPKWIWLVGTIAIMVIAKHHQNIKRLIDGTEPKIGKKRDAAAG